MSVLSDLRAGYHHRLSSGILGYRGEDRVPNIADSNSEVSKDLATRMVEKMGRTLSVVTKSGQTLGKEFGDESKTFLEGAFSRLRHIRPGTWLMTTSQSSKGIGSYEQYEHLVQLQRVLAEYPELKTTLGGDYLITPDIIVAREPLEDAEINKDESFVADDHAGRKSPLRKTNYSPSRRILHASISCKWTMRSDRAQNTRTEALNLIRHRKGNTPRIVVVTFEPLPTRIASIAMGTGDVDCTYHAALDELLEATRESGREDQLEVIENLVEGKRLRDISDLPLDLSS